MRHSYLVGALGAILTTTLPSLADAETWIVDIEGGGDFLGIQAAIDVAEDEDVIEVLSGTYEGSLDTLGKSLVLLGVDGSEGTFLLGTGVDPALRIEGGEEVEVQGFHISGANTVANPEFVSGGLHVEEATVSLTDLVISGNTAYVGAGAVFFQADVTATGLHFSSNFATPTATGDWGQGGAIYGYHSAGVFAELVVSDNSAQQGGGVQWVEGSLDISHAVFSDNL